MRQQTRNHLAELADAIKELTEPRTPRTHYEIEVLNKRGHRKRRRTAHKAELPSLLDALDEAIEPGADGDVLLVGNFESNPSADIGAIAAQERIQREAFRWARDLGVDVPELDAGPALRAVLPLLVSAVHGIDQRTLCTDALNWVRIARLATGYDVQFVPDLPCPLCDKRHTLVGSIDETDGYASPRVHCRNCGADWDEATIGLLTIMLEANRTRSTLTDAGPCAVYPGCYRRGPHDEHWDARGHRTTGTSALPALPEATPEQPTVPIPPPIPTR